MKRMLKIMLVLLALAMLGCDSSKSLNISEIKGVQQVIKFYAHNETTYPVQYIRVTGGEYASQVFFTKDEVNVITGVKYNIVWTIEDKSASPPIFRDITRNGEEFNFGGVSMNIFLGDTASIFIPRK